MESLGKKASDTTPDIQALNSRKGCGMAKQHGFIDALSCSKLLPHAHPNAKVYQYAGPFGWTLSIATVADEHRGLVSLGGNRIVPLAMQQEAGFNADAMAIALASGMQEKIDAMLRYDLHRAVDFVELTKYVGGKNVCLPTDEARIGGDSSKRRLEAQRSLLDFQVEAFLDFEQRTGIRLATGQDLGQDKMLDGVESVVYMNQHGVKGCVTVNTADPTARGVFHLSRGMLEAFDVAPAKARIGLVGFGKIGAHVADHWRHIGADVFTLESSPERQALAQQANIKLFTAAQRQEFFAEEMDAVLVNANGYSLDDVSVPLIIANKRLKVVTGAENLALARPELELDLLKAGKPLCPTETAGLMGAFAAAWEHHLNTQDQRLALDRMDPVARQLGVVGRRVVSAMRAQGFSATFEKVGQELFESQARH